MIKFFRNIRKRLLSENRISKYILYAVGEIFLVVVGILIALGVNNWNQDMKDQRLAEDLLSRIHSDLVQDTISFRSQIEHNNMIRKDIKELLVMLYDNVDSKEQVQHMSAIYDKALDQVFSPNDNTYRSMSISGSLGLIKNQELKEEIVELYSEYDEIAALLSSINEWMIGIVSTVDTETDFIRFNNFINDIYTSDEMLNEEHYYFLNDKDDRRFQILVRAISATAFNQKVRNAYYFDLISRCDKVLHSIDRELK